MGWRERERLFYWGSALAIVPALAFLPAFVALVFHPAIPHATFYAALLFPILAIAEFFGVFKLVRGCVARPFDLLTFLSFGALFVLLVIARTQECSSLPWPSACNAAERCVASFLSKALFA